MLTTIPPSTSQATATPASSAASVPPAQLTPGQLYKLRKAAKEFESILLANWWRSMKESGLPGSDESTDPGHDTLDQLGIQAVSSAVASSGGLGIGAMLVRGLLSNASHIAAAHLATPPKEPAAGATDI